MVTAEIIDGVLQETNKTDTKSKKSGSSLDKDAFLQLLVAQMKYQDPLEPTSNTEYISQFATFSELEQMQNLSSTSELQRASNLVGKTVIVETTSAAGKVSQVCGKVDYVIYENNKALLGINGSEYSLDDVVTVADDEFIEARDMAVALLTALNSLPTVINVTSSNKEAIASIQKVYEDMNDYQLSFISDDNRKLIEEYIAKLQEIIKQEEAEGGEDGDGDDTTGEDNSEGEGTEA